MRVSTLLGLDAFPAELAGLGPIPAGYARDLVADLGAAQWRYVITDESGHYLRGGLTPARPHGTPGRDATCLASVDLLIPAALLADLTTDAQATVATAATVGPDPRRRWQPVLAKGRSAHRRLAAALPAGSAAHSHHDTALTASWTCSVVRRDQASGSRSRGMPRGLVSTRAARRRSDAR